MEMIIKMKEIFYKVFSTMLHKQMFFDSNFIWCKLELIDFPF